MSSRSATKPIIGYGEVDLKAPLGASMPGYFEDRKATGTLDPLKAKALFVEVGDHAGAIVVLDLVGFGAAQVARCREAIASRTDIPAGRVWIHATHTHTGIIIPREFTKDAEAIFPGYYPGTVDETWIGELPGRVAEAVRLARQAGEKSAARLSQTRVEGAAFYRRFRMKDGTVKTNPGRNNPEVVAPVGEIDPTLSVIHFPEAKTLVAIFGVHPDTIGGTLYSADYPAKLTERVKEKLGSAWNVLFLNAACGNINHVDVNARQADKGINAASRIGLALGDAAVASLSLAEPIETDVLKFASRRVPTRLRTVPESDVKEAERLLREQPDQARSFNGLFAPAALVLGRTKEREQTAEIAALRLGSIGLVGLPGEIFVELAREIRHDSPFEPTRVVGLMNGSLGYIPHAEAFKQGGYETGYRSARFEPNAGHRWARTAVELLRSLA